MRKILIPLLAIGLLVGVSSQSDALSITLDDPGDASAALVVVDGGPGDTDGVVNGVVSYNGLVSATSTFTTNVTTGVSKPAIGSPSVAELDLSSVNASSLGAGTLLIGISDVGFTLTGQHLHNVSLEDQIGGTTQGTVSAVGGLDPANIPYSIPLSVGPLGPFGPGAFSGTVTAIFPPLAAAAPFSLTKYVIITHTGSGITSFDNFLTATVPEPSTVLLLGTGLLGLAGYVRRRK